MGSCSQSWNGDGPRSQVTDRLARFALGAFDGALVASKTDTGVMLGRLLEPLAPAFVAVPRALPATSPHGP